MEIKLKGREMPRGPAGDVKFLWLDEDHRQGQPAATLDVDVVFSKDEVVELVNRAIYHIEYQSGAHAKRAKRLRDAQRLLKEELKRQGKDPKAELVKDELKGDKL